MAVIKCANGHYYDDAKYQQCPHCQRNDSNRESSDGFDIGENKTVAKANYKNEDIIATQSLRSMVKNNSVEDSLKTVGIYSTGRNSNPIAGWLVGIKGENRGRSFEIHIGKNFVGRSMNNDIHINDERVSREQHFSVIYEPVNIEFYVMQGKGITYYNGTILCDAEKLQDGDIIQAGSSEYMFVPYCREGRDWNE